MIHVHNHHHVSGDIDRLIDVIRSEVDVSFEDEDDYQTRLQRAGM